MARTKLGRGLDSLLSRTQEPSPPPQGVTQIPTDQIQPNRYQPRTAFDSEALNGLKASIRANGILQPLVVRSNGTGYELIAGERRWRSATSLGLPMVPAIVREADDAVALEMALIENVQREDLNPIEKAQAYKELVGRFAMTQDQIAERVGQQRSTVANFLRLLELPEDIQDSVSRGTLTMGHARALLSLKTVHAQQRLAKRIETEALSVRAVEKIIKDGKESGQKKPRKKKSAHIRDLEKRLREALGTRVTIVQGANKGSVIVDFYSNDDFDRILEKLS